MVPLCMILFSSLLLFFHLLYNSLCLSLSFFLLPHYVLCLHFNHHFCFCYVAHSLSFLLPFSSLVFVSPLCFLLPLAALCFHFLFSSCFLQLFVLLYYYTFCFSASILSMLLLQSAFILLSSLICFLSSDSFFSNFSTSSDSIHCLLLLRPCWFLLLISWYNIASLLAD